MCIAKSRPTYWLSLLAVLVFATPQAAHAQFGEVKPKPKPKPNSNANADTGDFILRTYEVGDLVVNVPDYGAPGAPGAATSAPMNFGGGGMGGGGFGGGGVASRVIGGGGAMPAGQTPDPMQITFDSLIDAVTSVVAPSTWEVNGTGEGVVKSVGAALAVWQAPEVHNRIAEFLDMLRQGSAKRRTLSIDARWLMLDSQDLAKLADFSSDERKVDRKMLETLTRRPTSMRGMTHCFSGQLVYLISGTRRNVVSGYIPVVGSVERPEEAQLVELSDHAKIVFAQFGGGEGGSTIVSDRSVGYQPIIEKPNFGVLLEIRPTVMQGEDVAVVDLKSTVTFPGQPTSDDAQSSAFDTTPRVDRLSVEMQELATTLRLPLGEPVLVGGMTYLTPSLKQHDAMPEGSDAQPEESYENRQLYLVLEIR